MAKKLILPCDTCLVFPKCVNLVTIKPCPQLFKFVLGHRKDLTYPSGDHKFYYRMKKVKEKFNKVLIGWHVRTDANYSEISMGITWYLNRKYFEYEVSV